MYVFSCLQRDADWRFTISWLQQPSCLTEFDHFTGIVNRFQMLPDVVGMHGGLPPADAFPFNRLTFGLEHNPGEVLDISNPRMVAAAQQYNLILQVTNTEFALIVYSPAARLICVCSYSRYVDSCEICTCTVNHLYHLCVH